MKSLDKLHVLSEADKKKSNERIKEKESFEVD